MAISEEQVKHVAKLAKLAFADEELASFTDQLGKIIDMVEMLEKVAANQGVTVHKGVYGAVSGPNYCTKAELGMMIKLGSDTVGMSTVPEAITAKHCGLKVAGVSCITDMAIPDTMVAPTHEEIVRVAESVKPRFEALVKQFVKEVQLP